MRISGKVIPTLDHPAAVGGDAHAGVVPADQPADDGQSSIGDPHEVVDGEGATGVGDKVMHRTGEVVGVAGHVITGGVGGKGEDRGEVRDGRAARHGQDDGFRRLVNRHRQAGQAETEKVGLRGGVRIRRDQGVLGRQITAHQVLIAGGQGVIVTDDLGDIPVAPGEIVVHAHAVAGCGRVVVVHGHLHEHEVDEGLKDELRIVELLDRHRRSIPRDRLGCLVGPERDIPVPQIEAGSPSHFATEE